jgi:hypothetical protein
MSCRHHTTRIQKGPCDVNAARAFQPDLTDVDGIGVSEDQSGFQDRSFSHLPMAGVTSFCALPLT